MRLVINQDTYLVPKVWTILYPTSMSPANITKTKSTLALRSLRPAPKVASRGVYEKFLDYFVIILVALILGEELTLRKIIATILVFTALALLAI